VSGQGEHVWALILEMDAWQQAGKGDDPRAFGLVDGLDITLEDLPRADRIELARRVEAWRGRKLKWPKWWRQGP
jgi:hypothetical protein